MIFKKWLNIQSFSNESFTRWTCKIKNPISVIPRMTYETQTHIAWYNTSTLKLKSEGNFFETCGEVDHVRKPLKTGSCSKKSKFWSMETPYWTEIILKWKMGHRYTYQIAQPHHKFCWWKLPKIKNEKLKRK